MRRRLPPEHLRVLNNQSLIAEVQSNLGDHSAAIAASRELLDRLNAAFGDQDRLTISRQAEHAVILARASDESAKAVAAEAVQHVEQRFANTPLHLVVLDKQADVYREFEEWDQAFEVVRRRTALRPDFTSVFNVYLQFHENDQHDMSIRFLEKLIPEYEQAVKRGEFTKDRVQELSLMMGRLAEAHMKLRNFEQAVQWVTSVLHLEDQHPIDDDKGITTLLMLYQCNNAARRYAAAHEVAEERMTRMNNRCGWKPG